jgi:hypothetical protein
MGYQRVVAGLLFACAGRVAGHTLGTLRGIVVDTVGNPVPYAQVSINGTAVRSVSDQSGRFVLHAPARGTLSVRRLGFTPAGLAIDAALSADSRLRIILGPVPGILPTAIASARTSTLALELNGFYDRLIERSKGQNNGVFIGPEEVEARHPSSALNMLNGAAPSVSLMGKKVVGQGGACQMDVYVNRHLVDASDIKVGTHSLGGDQLSFRRVSSGRGAERSMHEPSPIDESAPASSIVGIEIYPRAVMAPPEFQRLAASCGIVLIWTR